MILVHLTKNGVENVPGISDLFLSDITHRGEKANDGNIDTDA